MNAKFTAFPMLKYSFIFYYIICMKVPLRDENFRGEKIWRISWICLEEAIFH